MFWHGSWTAALSREQEGWLDVTKWRLLRAFDLNGSDVVEITEGVLAAVAHTVELTAVRDQNHFWWTLALEATGAPDSLDENLRRLSDYYFGQANPPVLLDERHTYSYPAWLNTIT